MENSEFEIAATPDRIASVVAALSTENIEMVVVDTAAEAKTEVLNRVPEGSQVYSAKSKTLEDIGVAEELESRRFDSVRVRYMQMDRETQGDEIRRLMASPDYIVGSVNAITEAGELITTSYSGSQIGPYAAGARRVILVAGSQKIVRDLDEGLRRMRELVTPYEDERLRAALGVGTKAASILIQTAAAKPGRVTLIIVREPVGV